LGEAVEGAVERLAQAGVPDPRGEARRLCAAVLGTSPGQVWMQRALVLEGTAGARFASAVAERALGVPGAYATGLQAFRTFDLASDARALIPRPETEGLVDIVLEWARARWGAGVWGDAVDVGTGSGCIAIALAVEGRFRRVIATERSSQALALAQENVARVGVGGTVELRAGDVFAPLDGRQVDVVVSNPPYLSEAEYATLDASVRDHEPREALVGGVDGLVVTERLLTEARGRIRRGGLLAVEVDARRAHAVGERARRLGWREVRVERDLSGRPRYAVASL
jgi:release factor glutamine methyltransferase